MADFYSDTPLGPQEQAIKRRQQIAESLMAQGQTPLETNQMAGGYVVPVGAANVLAKLAQSYFGAKAAKVADDQYNELAKQRQQGVADALAQYQNTAQGTPAVTQEGEIQPARQGFVPSPEQFSDRPNFNTVPGELAPAVMGQKEISPAVAGNPRAAVTQAMMSQYPELQRFAAVEMANQSRKEDLATTLQSKREESQAARDARANELELRLQDARTSNADRLAMQKELAVMNHDTQVAIANQASEDRRFAVDNRAQAEHAPTMTEIVDPKDPSRMLRVDARTYQGGSMGSPGVLGISGKEPTAAKKEEQASQGQTSLSDSIATLRDYYKQLDANGAISNPKSGVLSNVSAGIQSSGAGQAAGRLFGTQNQSLRNSINMQRPLLLQAIKQATGMSAKQMDSNAELNLWLRSATDPSLDIKSNMDALDSIERKYLSGNKAPVNPASSSKPRVVDW